MMRISKAFERLAGRRSEAPDGTFQAVWNGTVLAQSDTTIVIEGNRYFPPQDVNFEQLQATSQQSTCPWKGVASYYDAVVDGERSDGAAWCYPQPSRAAAEIKDHVAFWKDVKVLSVPLATSAQTREPA